MEIVLISSIQPFSVGQAPSQMGCIVMVKAIVRYVEGVKKSANISGMA
jgi:hypothetical protein